jgi:hypothetical protein
MNILLYEPVGGGNNKQFHRMIEGLDLECGMEIYRTIESLSQRLRQPGKNLTVAVLLATSKQELLEILSIKELLFNVRIILVLPDREEDTITKGHSLRPRFLTYADSNYGDIAAVLSKMLGDNGNGEN